MSPEQRREVLEQLLARVRQTVAERGLSTTVDLPPRSMRPPAAASHAEQAVSHDGGGSIPSGGFHEMETAYAEVAPVVLASAMKSVPPPPPPPVSRPLVRFEFEDEVTATGDPGEIEAMVLAEAVAADADARAFDPPLSGPSTVPPAMPQPAVQAPRYEESHERRSVPLELEDLDSLGAPPPVTPSDAPPGPVVVPPLPKFEPPPDVENLGPLPSYELEPRYEPASPTSVDDGGGDDDDVIQLDAEDLASIPPEPLPAQEAAAEEEAAPETEHAGFVDRISIDDIEAAALPAPEPPPYVEPPRHVPPPAYVEPPAYAEPPGPIPEPAPVAADADPIPESQRQRRALDRAIDDRIDGIEPDDEPPPESGEVESQRYPASAAPIADEVSSDAVSAEGVDVGDDAPTPKPVLHEQTAETRSIGAVDVIERPPPPEVQVTQFSGSRPRMSSAFGELLDQALSLGE